MKRLAYITAVLVTVVVIIAGCDNKREPGRVYMPDMAYSRAFESYAMHDSSLFTVDALNKGGKIFYNSMPVEGTIKRGELFPYPLAKDTNNYKISGIVKNPLDSLDKADMTEAGRLFNINCAICHGEKAAGNGPLGTSGKIGGIANLTLPDYAKMADGTMFYSITFGKGNMGSYASQLSRKQRWSIVKYIRTLQPKPAAPGAPAAAPATAGGTTPATAPAATAGAKDSTAAKKG